MKTRRLSFQIVRDPVRIATAAILLGALALSGCYGFYVYDHPHAYRGYRHGAHLAPVIVPPVWPYYYYGPPGHHRHSQHRRRHWH